MSTNGNSPEKLSSPAEILLRKTQLQGQVREVAGDLTLIGSILSDVAFDASYPVDRLTPAQLRELDSASRGVSIKERVNETGHHPGTIDRRRYDLVRSLGAKSLPHAVRIGIVSGKLDLSMDGETSYLKPDIRQTLLMTSYGMSTEDIANAMGVSDSTVYNRVKEAKEELGAHNRPHLIRRGFESQVMKIPMPGGDISQRLRDAAESVKGLNGLAEDMEALAVDLSPLPKTEA